MNYQEQIIQQGIVCFFNLKYPKLKGLLCCNLNNSKDKKTGGRNKSLGVISGRSDLVLYYNSKTYHIEIKQPSGLQSTEQKQWQKTIEEAGFEYFIVNSTYEFMKVLEYIGL